MFAVKSLYTWPCTIIYRTRPFSKDFKMSAFWDIPLCDIVEVYVSEASWWRRQYAPLKRRSTLTKLHGAISQKAVSCILSAGRTLDLTSDCLSVVPLLLQILRSATTDPKTPFFLRHHSTSHQRRRSGSSVKIKLFRLRSEEIKKGCTCKSVGLRLPTVVKYARVCHVGYWVLHTSFLNVIE
jgi:hypothetical protein